MVVFQGLMCMDCVFCSPHRNDKMLRERAQRESTADFTGVDW